MAETDQASAKNVNLQFLDFEQPIAELEEKIEELRKVESDSEINIGDEISRLSERSEELTRRIFRPCLPGRCRSWRGTRDDPTRSITSISCSKMWMSSTAIACIAMTRQ